MSVRDSVTDSPLTYPPTSYSQSNQREGRGGVGARLYQLLDSLTSVHEISSRYTIQPCGYCNVKILTKCWAFCGYNFLRQSGTRVIANIRSGKIIGRLAGGNVLCNISCRIWTGYNTKYSNITATIDRVIFSFLRSQLYHMTDAITHVTFNDPSGGRSSALNLSRLGLYEMDYFWSAPLVVERICSLDGVRSDMFYGERHWLVKWFSVLEKELRISSYKSFKALLLQLNPSVFKFVTSLTFPTNFILNAKLDLEGVRTCWKLKWNYLRSTWIPRSQHCSIILLLRSTTKNTVHHLLAASLLLWRSSSVQLIPLHCCSLPSTKYFSI